MPIERRCLVPGCDCESFTIDIEAYDSALDDGDDVVETGEDELQSFCVLCGHTETEHELASAD